MTMHERRPVAYEDCVADADRYLAPALEGLLIETLHPKLNVHKKRK